MLKRQRLEDSPFIARATTSSSSVDETSGPRAFPNAHQPGPSMPTEGPTATTSTPSTANTEALRIDSICEISTIKLLIDDYFNYIHPVIPLPHEPTFRAAFARRDDRVDRRFAALIAAMIEILVASFPRRPRKRFTSVHLRRRYPSAGALIDRCHQLFNDARGIGFTDREPTLDDALGSYLAGLSAGYVFDMARQRRYLGECVMMLRTLGFHSSDRPSTESPSTNRPSGTQDYIHQQSGRRLFWLCFVGTMSIRQLGGYDSDVLMPPSSPAELLPPLPIETDDEYIYPFTILAQPPSTVSTLTGFNLNVRIFRAYHNLTWMEMYVGREYVYDRDQLRLSIRSALADVKTIMDSAPKELQLVSQHHDDEWPLQDTQNGKPMDRLLTTMDPSAKIIGHEYTNNADSSLGGPRNEEVRYEIQKANIYATQLATRSCLVEKFWNTYDIQDRRPIPSAFASPVTSPDSSSAAGVTSATTIANQGDELLNNGGRSAVIDDSLLMGAVEHAMAVEREAIVRDMALLVRNINRVNMEPNGMSICNKIRQVASTLLRQDRNLMSEMMPRLDRDSVNDFLIAFCDILSKLERIGPGKIRAHDEGGVSPSGSGGGGGGGGGGGPLMARTSSRTAQEIEDEELVCWASLKEHQERFVERNGWIANI